MLFRSPFTTDDCDWSKACMRSKCQNPCLPGTCGYNARCEVSNHIPQCICNEGMSGNPFSGCQEIRVIPTAMTPVDPCRPSPCGPFSQCRESNGQAICTCLQGQPDFTPTAGHDDLKKMKDLKIYLIFRIHWSSSTVQAGVCHIKRMPTR